MSSNRNFPFQKAGLRPPLANNRPTNRVANPIATGPTRDVGYHQTNTTNGGNTDSINCNDNGVPQAGSGWDTSGTPPPSGAGFPDIGALIAQIITYFEGFTQDAIMITDNIQTITEEITAGRQQLENFVVKADTFISRATIFGIIILLIMIVGLILLVVIAFRTGYHHIIPTVPTTLGVTNPRYTTQP